MIDRVQLAHLPTPLEELPRLSAHLGGPRLMIKRDDLTGLGPGGNKTRKLEFLAADALRQGCRMLVSTGALQSNHCRQVAAAAARLGLKCTLVLAGQPPQHLQGNLLLDHLSGAHVVFVPPARRDEILQQVFDQAAVAGERPYLIPYGGSNALGALGYTFAMQELLQQARPPDWIVFATSSGGTQAGLLLGAHRSGFTGKILGISVDKSAAELQPVVSEVAQAGAALLNESWAPASQEILIETAFCQAGYGNLQPAEGEAIRLFARLEGILLDPVYTGRAAAGLIELIHKGQFQATETILFWHTGGTPALFAEPYSSALAA